MQVLNGTEQLLKIIARKWFVKTTFGVLHFDVGEKVALLDEFENNKVNLNCLARVLDNDFAFAVVLNQPYDIGVAHFLQESNLVEKNLLEHFQTNFLHVVSLYNLYGIELVGVVFAGG